MLKGGARKSARGQYKCVYFGVLVAAALILRRVNMCARGGRGHGRRANWWDRPPLRTTSSAGTLRRDGLFLRDGERIRRWQWSHDPRPERA